MNFQLSLLEFTVQTLEVPALRSTVQHSDERFLAEMARGQSGRNLLGLFRSSCLDHGQLAVTGSHKGNGGGAMLFHERSQSLLKR